MKFIKTACFIGSFLYSANLAGQDQLFFIHEDDVKPSMVDQYQETSMELAKVLRASNLPELVTYAHRQVDNVFMWASPVKNLAELDKNIWQSLEEKIGKEKFDKLFDGYHGTYSSHRSYLVKYRHESSYIPEGSQPGPEAPYRRWDYNWVDPSMGEEAIDITKEWVALYESKNVSSGYQIYTGGLGTDVPLVVVYRWAKDEADMAAKMAAAQEALGQEAQALWRRTSKMLVRTSIETGWFMPNLSYVPPQDNPTSAE